MITPEPMPRRRSRFPSEKVSAATSMRTTAGKIFAVTATTACGVAAGNGSAADAWVDGPPSTAVTLVVGAFGLLLGAASGVDHSGLALRMPLLEQYFISKTGIIRLLGDR